MHPAGGGQTFTIFDIIKVLKIKFETIDINRSGLPKDKEMPEHEIQTWVDSHEFPNKVSLREGVKDMDGKEVPTDITLHFQASAKLKGEEIFGKYMDEDGNILWIDLEDADYGAQRVSGYTNGKNIEIVN